MHLTIRNPFTYLLGIYLALAGNGPGATIVVTEFIFDDFLTPYSAPIEGEPALQPRVMEVTRTNPHQLVVDSLTTGDTVGATRSTILNIHPIQAAGDLTVFTAAASSDLPPRLSLNADFLTAGTLKTEYDFSPIGESVNAAVDTTHVIIDLVSTDNRDSGLIVTFTDLDGNTVSKDVTNDLGVDLTTPGKKSFPFAEFAPIDFTKLTGLTLDWRAGTAYDGEIAIIATGVELEIVPEPSTSLLALIGASWLMLSRRRQG